MYQDVTAVLTQAVVSRRGARDAEASVFAIGALRLCSGGFFSFDCFVVLNLFTTLYCVSNFALVSCSPFSIRVLVLWSVSRVPLSPQELGGAGALPPAPGLDQRERDRARARAHRTPGTAERLRDECGTERCSDAVHCDSLRQSRDSQAPNTYAIPRPNLGYPLVRTMYLQGTKVHICSLHAQHSPDSRRVHALISKHAY